MAVNCDRPTCRGHRVFVGGRLDGEIAHLPVAAHGDYFLSLGTLLADGQRSWYLRDGDQRWGDVTYRFVGIARDMPDVVKRAHEAAARFDGPGTPTRPGQGPAQPQDGGNQ